MFKSKTDNSSVPNNNIYVPIIKPYNQTIFLCIVSVETSSTNILKFSVCQATLTAMKQNSVKQKQSCVVFLNVFR